jgi:hypothetical protein
MIYPQQESAWVYNANPAVTLIKSDDITVEGNSNLAVCLRGCALADVEMGCPTKVTGAIIPYDSTICPVKVQALNAHWNLLVLGGNFLLS